MERIVCGGNVSSLCKASRQSGLGFPVAVIAVMHAFPIFVITVIALAANHGIHFIDGLKVPANLAAAGAGATRLI